MMTDTDLRATDFEKLAKGSKVAGSKQPANADEQQFLQIAQLDQLLEAFGLRLCRSAARAADSWHYEGRNAQQVDDQFAFTLGELYMLLETAKEIQRAYRSSPLWRKLVQLVPKKPVVFLGGTCSTTTWRQDVAVPFCRANDFNYFDPQEPARSWSPGLIHVEERAKLESSAFIFYVSNAARSLTSMIEVAYLVARRKNLIAVISRMPVHVGDCDEASGDPERDYITSSEQEQLCRARDELVRLVECNGYPVFETLQDALDSCAALIRERAEVDELISKHALLPLQLVASRYRDRMSHLHFAFISCAAGASHIQFSQAYTLLQQACARENVSCARLPHCTRRALFSLLVSASEMLCNTLTRTEVQQVADRARQHHQLDSSRKSTDDTTVQMQQSADDERKSDGNVLDKLLNSFVRNKSVVCLDEDPLRPVSFNQLCFLFAWMLECDLARRSNRCAVLDSLGNVADFFRCLFTYMLDNVNKYDKPVHKNDNSQNLPSDCHSHSQSQSHGRCGHERRPLRSETVHLRGSISDCSLMDDLLIPLLSSHAVPFCLGVSNNSGRHGDRCACDCARSQQCCLPDLVRMTESHSDSGPVEPQGVSHEVLGDTTDDSLCNRLRERFADRLRYRCPLAHCRLLLCVFTRKSKNVAEMVQCAQCIGEGPAVHRRILLLVEMFELGDAPDGEVLNDAALKDYNRVRMYLLSMAKSHSETVRIANSRDELVILLANEIGLRSAAD